MHVHFGYQHVSRNPQIDKTVHVHVGKLRKLLTRFSPDLIHLHGVLEFSAAHQGPVCSLNLWLPTAQLHVRKEGNTALTTLQSCFTQLLEQVKKHKQVLRREDVWKRRRYKFQQEAREMEAGEARVQDRQQLRDYMEQVLPQLGRFIARELRYREMSGLLRPGQTQPEEIMDEVVARALENVAPSRPDSNPFHRLVSEAVRVLNGPLTQPAGASAESVPVAVGSAPEGMGAVAGGKIAAAHLWRQSKALPSETDHPPDPIDLLLASLPLLNRQVYVLHALEGFSWEETAQVLGNPPQDVEELFRQVSQEVSAALHPAPPSA